MSKCHCNYFTVSSTFSNNSINTDNATGSNSNIDTAAGTFSATDTINSTITNGGLISLIWYC